MAGARHPKPYVEGEKTQVTVPWKRRVLAKLAVNKAMNGSPNSPEQLKDAVGAPKSAINKLLDLKRDPPQLTSTYTDAITRILGVDPPILENEDDDPEFARYVLLLRSLTPAARRALMSAAEGMDKK